ncbi:MAG: glycosyltransferase [Candidatus Komeilibacteria bacterium]|nr:glycosyltransferase [Candidatus Komeilibacteria bacterium]
MGNVAYHLASELEQLGNSVQVFTPAVSGASARFDQSVPFPVHRLQPIIWFRNSAVVPQLLWKLRNFDIVHLHYPFFGGAEMIYARTRVWPMKLVIQYHMDVVGEGLLKRLFALHSTYLMPRILRSAERIIVTSMDYAQQSRIGDMIAEYATKFIEIPLGVNPELFKPRMKSRELLDRHKLQNKKIVLFVGSLDRAHYFKGVTYLIKAFQLIASNDMYRLIIVGNGNLKTSYESLVVNFGLERKVTFATSVSDEQLPLYYNLADVFVLPSIDGSEAFGISILEAMASGIPVVASDLPGVRSVVQKDSSGYLFKPKNIAVLAKYIHFLLENPQVGNQFGVAGRLRVLDNYTWSVVGKRVNEVYEEVP